jgi:hypothetical protein
MTPKTQDECTKLYEADLIARHVTPLRARLGRANFLLRRLAECWAETEEAETLLREVEEFNADELEIAQQEIAQVAFGARSVPKHLRLPDSWSKKGGKP